MSLAIIIKIVSKVFGFSDLELKSQDRKSEISDARLMYYYLAKEHTSETLKEIASFVLRIDHSTAKKGIKRATDLIDCDPEYRRKYEACQTIIQANKMQTNL